MKRFVFLVALVCSIVSSTSLIASGLGLEERIYRASNWRDLRSVHRILVGRLDGVLAGAFTDKVAELFSKKWAMADEFANLAALEPVFERDVFLALNEAVTQTQASEILENAITRCPSHHVKLCGRLVETLRAAMRGASVKS